MKYLIAKKCVPVYHLLLVQVCIQNYDSFYSACGFGGMQGYSVLSMDSNIVLFKNLLNAKVWRTVRLVHSISVIVQLQSYQIQSQLTEE